MDADRRRYLRLCALGTGVSLAGCTGLFEAGSETDDTPDTDTEQPPGTDTTTTTGTPVEKIDDWQYEPPRNGDGANASGAKPATSGASGAADLGLSTGGATNIASFRRNLEEGYLPLPQSLAYEGLFYNYYFETGDSGACQSLFCPSYSTAVTADPLSGTTERYLTVGLNSTLSTTDFERKDLNLVVVVDISGSMGSGFSEYYYDRFGNKHQVDGDDDRSKIDVATDALQSLTEQLRPGDRLGVVLFNQEANVAKPLRPVEATDMDAIRGHIENDIEADGGTNLDAGIEAATEMLAEYSDADQTTTETRQIVLTDAMPNLGETDDRALQARLSRLAEDRIHTTFVGVGVDFNPKLVDQITAVEGANYRTVHSASQFEQYLGEEFAYMVTPLVYDLDLELDAEGAEITKVYGSSVADPSNGALLQVNTLFPSPKRDGETRGGVVLVQLDGVDAGEELTLRASWEDRTGTTSETTTSVSFPTDSPEYFAHTGIRKAVLLARYADLLKNWLVHERDPTLVSADGGIGVPPDETLLGEWEQQSQPLAVDATYADRIRRFREYFRAEMDTVGDDALEQELQTMATILAAEQ